MHGIKMKNLLETGNIPSSESWETNLIEKVLKPFLLGKYTGKKSSFFTVYTDICCQSYPNNGKDNVYSDHDNVYFDHDNSDKTNIKLNIKLT